MSLPNPALLTWLGETLAVGGNPPKAPGGPPKGPGIRWRTPPGGAAPAAGCPGGKGPPWGKPRREEDEKKL